MLLPFTTTGVGSMPQKNIQQVLHLISLNTDIPFLPQLPNISYKEGMYIQFSESLPCINLDEKFNLFIDKNCLDNKLEYFYNNFILNQWDYFSISDDYLNALKPFVNYFFKNQFIKFQITGPVSYGLSISLLPDKKPALYDEIVMDIIVKNIIAKAKWLVNLFKSKIKNLKKMIIFFDEPFLASLGSGYINISRENVISYFQQIIESVKEEDIFIGVHCCGNTDWQTLLELNLDIINFDAFNYMDKFILYTQDIKQFIKRGGKIAWGLVPTVKESLKNVDISDLINLYDKGFKALKKTGIDENNIISSSILTPSCGFSNVDSNLAEKGIILLKDLKLKLKEVYL